MKIYLRDQASRFATHLANLQELDVIPYHKSKLKHKVSTVEISTEKAIGELDLADFFNYNIFPKAILLACTQWEHQGRAMMVNDTVVQQIQIPPSRSFSQKIITGVRISEIIDTPTRRGFSYKTLKGHVEKGISSFYFELKHNSLIFTVETYSAPNGVFLSLFQPFSLWYQNYCTQQALQHVKDNYMKM